MRTIWKYHLKLIDEQMLELPQGAYPLSVGVQKKEERIGYRESLYLWMQLDPEQPKKDKYHIWIVGTGAPIPFPKDTQVQFIGTAQMADGALVWHVFVSII